MSPTPDALVRRRAVLAGGLFAFGLAIVATSIIEAPLLFGRRYKPSPFDDLLSQLPDRDNMAQLGKAVLADERTLDVQAAASQLRAALKDKSLAELCRIELTRNQTVEIRGWILPRSLAALGALAASAPA